MALATPSGGNVGLSANMMHEDEEDVPEAYGMGIEH